VGEVLVFLKTTLFLARAERLGGHGLTLLVFPGLGRRASSTANPPNFKFSGSAGCGPGPLNLNPNLVRTGAEVDGNWATMGIFF